MKKLAIVFAVILVIAFAVPVFADADPLKEVPANNWVHSALNQLASNGIIQDALDQPITRGVVASALANTLTDDEIMTKASTQDKDNLEKLVVEFNDELQLIGLQVNTLDDIVFINP